MSIDCIGEFDENFGLPSSEPMPSIKTDYHEAIFSQESCSRPFKKEAVLRSSLTESESKIQKAVGNKKDEIASRGCGGSGEVGVTADWGGKEGAHVSGYMKGEAHDDQGNYAKIEAEQRSDGTGSVSASAGRKKD